MNEIMVDNEKCIQDSLCQDVCPMGILVSSPPEKIPRVLPDMMKWCIGCGHCVAICPTGALNHPLVSAEGATESPPPGLPDAGQVERLMKSRRSVRRFGSESPDQALLKQMITMAACAPSGHNARPVNWTVFTCRKDMEHLAELSIEYLKEKLNSETPPPMAAFFAGVVKAWDNHRDVILHHCPCLVIGHCKKRIGTEAMDTAIAMTYMELAAHSLGLGCCWAGLFSTIARDCDKIRKFLKLPGGHTLYGAMMVGIPLHSFEKIPVRTLPVIHWRNTPFDKEK